LAISPPVNDVCVCASGPVPAAEAVDSKLDEPNISPESASEVGATVTSRPLYGSTWYQ